MNETQECKTNEECKKVALDRFIDSFILFKGERYQATVYMAGYAIEIAIKAEFKRLIDKEIDKRKIIDIINFLAEQQSINKEIKGWFNSTHFSYPPKTLLQLFEFFTKITLLHNSMHNNAYFKIIINPKNSYQKRDKNDSFHNLSNYFEMLNKWKNVLYDEYSEQNNYDFKNWKVEMRYSVGDVIKHDAISELKQSLKFLEKELQIKNKILILIKKELESSIEEEQEQNNKEQNNEV